MTNTDLTSIFKQPELKPIIKLFGDADSYYQIPDYQRPYDWRNEQVEQLWDDIYEAMESGSENYFLGSIILTGPNNDGFFEVVDGQQRLTTLTILLCVLRDLYLKNDNRIFNSIKSMVDQRYRLRLVTQAYYQNQFEHEILDGVKLTDGKHSSKDRNGSKFTNAAAIFKDKLDEIANKKNEINRLVDYILNKVVLIIIKCSKLSFAVKLFQVLNTRGLDLSNADLLKSYLYAECDTSKKPQLISTWMEVETVSREIEEDLTDIFTYYQNYLLARVPKFSLYDELIKQFKKRDPNKVLYELKEFLDSYVEVYKMETKIIFSLWYLPNQFFWKSILASAKHEGTKDFTELCRLLRNLYYSYWIAGYTTTKVKQLSFNLISWIKGDKGIGSIRREIDKKMKEDDVYKRMRDNLEKDVYAYSWLRPLLVLIEYEQTDDSKISYIPLDKNLHVDHILPEKWSSVKEWRDAWEEEDARAWVGRIGNLTILSGKKNIAAQNYAFEKKRAIYRSAHGGLTAFEISKRIAEKESWDVSAVKNRQEWLLRQANTILNITGD